MKRVISLILLTIFLTSCSNAASATIEAPATAAAIPATATATATATTEPTPTEATAPSMENLPAEWQGRIDRVETMRAMDGTERIVAIQKLTDEDIAAGKTEAKLRTLQWDAETKGWVDYVPQVGLVAGGASWWSDVEVDNLPVSEILARMNKETITGKDGQEIPPGVVGSFSNYTLICGDVVEVFYYHSESGYTNIDQVIAVPLTTGDIELIYVAGGSPTRAGTVPVSVYDLASVDPLAYAGDPAGWAEKSLSSALTRLPISTDNQGYWRYTQAMIARGGQYRRIVFEVPNRDLPTSLVGPDGKLARGEVVALSNAHVNIEGKVIVSASDGNLFQ